MGDELSRFPNDSVGIDGRDERILKSVEVERVRAGRLAVNAMAGS